MAQLQGAPATDVELQRGPETHIPALRVQRVPQPAPPVAKQAHSPVQVDLQIQFWALASGLRAALGAALQTAREHSP